MNDRALKSFDYAADLCKQLITLSTVLIGVSATFLNDFESNTPRFILTSSWILLFLSIFVGIFTLMSLAGVLGQTDGPNNQSDNATLVEQKVISPKPALHPPSIYSSNIRLFAGIQILLFVLGLACTIVFSSGVGKKSNRGKEECLHPHIQRTINYSLVDTLKVDTVSSCCVGIKK